ncbi:hypothetical protein TRV_01836 [Trichophyton verrucosum HKI 0517]|uniref:Uncharacterized protein n=1 Tax=Trichophyton verrucosum (strain HKI 0517) TaxID=663202 RepID=D4D423_TRIVH|nr:uncharacterized protein TRV_01836 [Trichophyton verrucosum HKI 0517]EFE43451.1 hypothetical protein TRV_01836 [Trichophyton verrucosum HKI 0517]
MAGYQGANIHFFFNKEKAGTPKVMLNRYIYETRSSELPTSEWLYQKAFIAASSKATDGLLWLDI